jgi:hypothetical protein
MAGCWLGEIRVDRGGIGDVFYMELDLLASLEQIKLMNKNTCILKTNETSESNLLNLDTLA